MIKSQTIAWQPFAQKHKDYIRDARHNRLNVAEGAIRAGKTIDNCIIAAMHLETCSDMYHLASGSTLGNAKLNIGVCNGFGLEALFRGRCHWGKYKDNEALFINTQAGEKVIIFVGGGKADSYKRILGNSYGLWIATEINEHFDKEDSRTSFIKVAMGRQAAAKDPLILWDLNPCAPKHPIYTDYIDKYKEDFIGGYQYQHFTIEDNLSISEQRKAEIKSQYDPNSIWYKRDILGQRVAADGLIYPIFANSRDKFKSEPLRDLMEINIGVDFGGGKSGHAFVATGISRGYNHLRALASERYVRKDQRVEIDPDKLGELFIDFCRKIIAQYGVIHHVYCDSAEQTLIAGLRSAARKSGMPWLASAIGDALKTTINDRINATIRLMAQGRFSYIAEECQTLDDAFCGAVWNPKKLTEDERLDDGTSDIDTLDAFEYTFERNIAQLIRYER